MKAFPATFETMLAAPDGSPERAALEQVVEQLEGQAETFSDAADTLGVTVGFAL